MNRARIQIELEAIVTDKTEISGDPTHAAADRVAAAQALATFHLADMLADVGPAIERLSLEAGSTAEAIRSGLDVIAAQLNQGVAVRSL